MRRRRAREALTDYTTPSEQALIDEVAKIPSKTWFELSKWARETDNLQGWQRRPRLQPRPARGVEPTAVPEAGRAGEKILTEAQRLGFRVLPDGDA